MDATTEQTRELKRALADAEDFLERRRRELVAATETHRLAALAVSVLRDALKNGRDDG